MQLLYLRQSLVCLIKREKNGIEKEKKNYRKMTKIQKARTRAKQSEKTATEHTRVRLMELREKVVFTS